MVMGNRVPCANCGKTVVSCVLPAYCYNCDPFYQELRKQIRDKIEPTEDELCTACNGKGRVVSIGSNEDEEEVCNTCGGSGRLSPIIRPNDEPLWREVHGDDEEKPTL